MENQKIKEDRRRKFLEKMESRNKANKGNKKQSNNNNNTNNFSTSIPQNKIDNQQPNKNNINNQSPFFNMASNPNINNINQNQAKDILNNIFNNQNKQEIDFKNII